MFSASVTRINKTNNRSLCDAANSPLTPTAFASIFFLVAVRHIWLTDEGSTRVFVFIDHT